MHDRTLSVDSKSNAMPSKQRSTIDKYDQRARDAANGSKGRTSHHHKMRLIKKSDATQN